MSYRNVRVKGVINTRRHAIPVGRTSEIYWFRKFATLDARARQICRTCTDYLPAGPSAAVGGRNAPSRATRALYGDGDVASKPLKPLFSNTLLSFAATRPLTHAPACRFAATHWGMVLPLRGHSPLHQPHVHNMHISLSKQDILGSMHSSQLNTSVLQHCTQMLMCSAITWTLASVSCESGV